MERVVIIKYGAGNLFSVRVAIERLGYEVVCSADPRVVREADKVIFPGVGQAATAMRQLRESGMDRVISELKVPVLGICLGMQLMCAHSEEGNTEGLGIFPMRVKEFGKCSKVPHMGWNGIRGLKSGLFDGIVEGEMCISCIRIMCLLVSMPSPRVIIRWLFLRQFVKIISGDVSSIRKNRLGLGKR